MSAAPGGGRVTCGDFGVPEKNPRQMKHAQDIKNAIKKPNSPGSRVFPPNSLGNQIA